MTGGSGFAPFLEKRPAEALVAERKDIDFSYTLTDRVVRMTLGPVGRRR